MVFIEEVGRGVVGCRICQSINQSINHHQASLLRIRGVTLLYVLRIYEAIPYITITITTEAKSLFVYLLHSGPHKLYYIVRFESGPLVPWYWDSSSQPCQ